MPKVRKTKQVLMEEQRQTLTLVSDALTRTNTLKRWIEVSASLEPHERDAMKTLSQSILKLLENAIPADYF